MRIKNIEERIIVMRKIPAILSDIDGVLLRGKSCIPRSDRAAKFIRKPLRELNPKLFGNSEHQIPFLAVTNGGGKLEFERANDLNRALNLQGHEKLSGNNVIMNFSPLRPIFKDFLDKVILISGVGDIERIVVDCGVHKFVTISEYCALYPSLVPISQRSIKTRAEILERVKQRLKISNHEFFEDPFKVDAIFFINDPIVWEESIQVTLDLLTTPDGRIADKLPKEAPDTHIPIFAVNNDFLYSDSFRLPRLAFGPFTESLRHIYRLLHKKDLHINLFGKPEKSTFAYAG